jgi:hypothetical protein
MTIQYILLHVSAAAHRHQRINTYLKPNNKIYCITIISVTMFIRAKFTL